MNKKIQWTAAHFISLCQIPDNYCGFWHRFFFSLVDEILKWVLLVYNCGPPSLTGWMWWGTGLNFDFTPGRAAVDVARTDVTTEAFFLVTLASFQLQIEVTGVFFSLSFHNIFYKNFLNKNSVMFYVCPASTGTFCIVFHALY